MTLADRSATLQPLRTKPGVTKHFPTVAGRGGAGTPGSDRGVSGAGPDSAPRAGSGAMPLRVTRWIGAGLVDQVVVAAANAGITLVGLVLLDRHRAGVMMLSLGVGYFAMYLNRAFVGDVLIALGSRYDDGRRDCLVSSVKPPNRCASLVPRRRPPGAATSPRRPGAESRSPRWYRPAASPR
jgi:hypothetical protein